MNREHTLRAWIASFFLAAACAFCAELDEFAGVEIDDTSTLLGVAGLSEIMGVTVTSADTYFTLTFASGTPPTNVILHAGYGGPATPAQALYDAGDGNWTAYSSNTITLAGSYLKIRGDWRTAAGTYDSMLYNSLAGAGYTCEFDGTLDYAATNAYAYNEIFRSCTSVSAINENPFQAITGTPAASMFYLACYNMSGVTNLPTGFMDTSGLTGTPAASMLRSACNGMSGVTNLPTGFMDTSGLTGTPAPNMLRSACNGMSGVTNLPTGFLDTSGLTGTPATYMFASACNGMSGVTNLPTGFLDTSGLTGTPATYMFYLACSGMSGLASGNITISSNVTFTAANLTTTAALTATFSGDALWGGQLYWGTNVIHTVLTPTNDLNTFAGCTNMPDYGTIDANWK